MKNQTTCTTSTSQRTTISKSTNGKVVVSKPENMSDRRLISYPDKGVKASTTRK